MRLRFTAALKRQIVKWCAQERPPSKADISSELHCDNLKADRVHQEVIRRRREIAATLDVSMPGQHRTNTEGFIYLVENPAYPGWVKAGMTVDCAKRLISYNTCDPLQQTKFIATRRVENRRRSERILLNSLAQSAECRRSEWFQITTEDALRLFNTIC